MASRKDRFGDLGGPGGGTSGPGRTADLFEHYGIAVDPATETATVVAVNALPCRRCGWFLACEAENTPCPLCAQTAPHQEPESKTSPGR